MVLRLAGVNPSVNPHLDCFGYVLFGTLALEGLRDATIFGSSIIPKRSMNGNLAYGDSETRMLVDNATVPFTLAHGAAALPFRRVPLVFSALLVGTFAPDFEYFFRLSSDDGFGHTLLGALVVTLPLAWLVLWLFHTYVKLPVARLLPDAIQRRLTNHLDEFRFRGAARVAMVAGSILLGIATHLAWDSFTHPNTWPYHHWSILGQLLHLPVLGPIPVYKVLQHGGTLVGIGALLAWWALWYRTSEPSGSALGNAVSPQRKKVIGTIVTTIAVVGALIRAVAVVGVPHGHSSERRFLGSLVVTGIALVWWQLVAYGVFSSRDASSAIDP